MQQFYIDFECFIVRAKDDDEAGKIARGILESGRHPELIEISFVGEPEDQQDHPNVPGITIHSALESNTQLTNQED